ncbi:uncharacterized protein hmgxb4b isoform 4-T6 [Menidia menidia]
MTKRFRDSGEIFVDLGQHRKKITGMNYRVLWYLPSMSTLRISSQMDRERSETTCPAEMTSNAESPIPTEEHRECLDNQHNMAEGQEQKPVSDRQHVSVPVSVSLAALAGPEVSDVISDDPVSAAAHLHLLGEALSLIGRHLQETNKMVCMSGTLSLLLDSLLCALAPLMCLTTQIPELTSDTECPLAPTLENIAYVMPGL